MPPPKKTEFARPAQRPGYVRGHPVDPKAASEVRALLGESSRNRERLIEFLHLLQDRHGYLYPRHLLALAQELKLAPVEIYEVASFYHHFEIAEEDASPPPALTVRVCDSLACCQAGAQALLAALHRDLGEGVRVVPVPCVGRCDQAPVAVVGEHPVAPADTRSVLRAIDSGKTTADLPDQALDLAAYRAQGGYSLLESCFSGRRTSSQVIKAIEDSGLRGLGGAGFPVGRKWHIVRDQPRPKYLAVNIDEGEPGTFKDRYYLEQSPHQLLEGALIAAWATGCEAVYLYLRDEYAGCRALLKRELDALHADPPGLPHALPRIELRRGAGAYICGEESAMLESLEGKRGMPRQRPPFVAEQGLFGRPTLVQNCESLYWVRDLLERGSDWFLGQGRRGRQGLRSFSLSGRVKSPGVYLAPAGISVRELIEEYAGGMQPGHELYGYFPGGASGGILPARLADLPLDFDTLTAYGCFIGSAAVFVFSQQDRARDLALNAMRFFAHESCGQCTPCRVGTARASELMQAPTWERAKLDALAQVMSDASICGLGQAAPNPMRCVIEYFPEEVGLPAQAQTTPAQTTQAQTIQVQKPQGQKNKEQD